MLIDSMYAGILLFLVFFTILFTGMIMTNVYYSTPSQTPTITYKKQ
jgi:hypothetical protein